MDTGLDRLLQTVRERVTQARGSGDYSLLTEPEFNQVVAYLFEVALQLEQGSEDGREFPALDVLVELGWVLWHRSLAPDCDPADREHALSMLDNVFVAAPWRLPPEAAGEVRSWHAARPGPHPADLWDDQAVYLLDRYRESRDPGLLERAAGLAEAALSDAPKDDAEARRASRTQIYAEVLVARATIAKNPQDAVTAADLARAALDLTPAGGPERQRRLMLLCLAVRAAAKLTRATAGLDEALALLQDASWDGAAMLWALGLQSAVWMTRYQISLRADDLLAATARAREAKELSGAAGPAEIVIQYAECLYLNHERTGDVEALQEAITVLRAALDSREDQRDRPAQLLLMRLSQFSQRSSELAQAQPGHLSDQPGSIHAHPLARLGELLEQAIRGNPAALDQASARIAEFLADEHLTARQELANPAITVAGLLLARFEEAGRLPDLDQCILLMTAGLDLLPPDQAMRSALLADLGAIHRRRFAITDDPGDLAAAVDAGRSAVSLAPGKGDGLLATLTNLTNTLQVRFDRSLSPADIQEAITLARRVVQAIGREHPRYELAVTNLGNALHRRYRYSGTLADADESVTWLREALGDPAAIMAQPAKRLANLSGALFDRQQQTGSAVDLDEAIALARAAVEVSDERDPSHANHVAALAGMLTADSAPAAEGRHPADRDEAVRLARYALDVQQRAGRPDAEAMLALGLALTGGVQGPGDQGSADTTEGLAFMHRALDLMPMRSARRIHGELTLAAAYSRIFQHTSDADALDRGIAAARRSRDGGAGPGGPLQPGLRMLGTLLMTKFQQTGEALVLAEAAACLEATAPFVTADDFAGFSNLSKIRLWQYQQDGDPAALQAAVDFARAAVQATDSDRGPRVGGLISLSSTLLAGYEHLHRASDLEDAIEAAREAVDLADDDSSVRPLALASLGAALKTRARSQDGEDAEDGDHPHAAAGIPPQAGDSLDGALWASIQHFTETRDPEDLDSLLEAARLIAQAGDQDVSAENAVTVRALNQLNGSREQMADEAHTLAYHMFSTYEATRSEHLLPGTALLSRIAAALGDPATDKGRMAVVTQGMILCEWFRASAELSFLLEGIALLRRAFRDSADGSAIWVASASQLAMALAALAHEQGESWTLDASIRLHEDLLRRPSAEFDPSAASHHNFASALRARYAAGGEATDLERALVQQRAAIAATGPGDPYAAVRRESLAHTLFLRHAASEDSGDLDEAIAQTRSALYQQGVKPSHDPRLVLASYLLLRFDTSGSQADLRSAEEAMVAAKLDRQAPGGYELTLQGLRMLLRWETAKEDVDLKEAAVLFERAFASDRLIAQRWALAAIGHLRKDDKAAVKRGERAWSSLQDAGLEQRPPDDELVLIAQRFFTRNCTSPDPIPQRS